MTCLQMHRLKAELRLETSALGSRPQAHSSLVRPAGNWEGRSRGECLRVMSTVPGTFCSPDGSPCKVAMVTSVCGHGTCGSERPSTTPRVVSLEPETYLGLQPRSFRLQSIRLQDPVFSTTCTKVWVLKKALLLVGAGQYGW